MPGLLYHSPARIIAELLISAGHGIDGEGILPTNTSAWPIYIDAEPDKPDQLIKVSNTAGRNFGDIQVDGEYQEHQGIQIMVRTKSGEAGYVKTQRIATFLDQVRRNLVDIAQVEAEGTGTVSYQIHAITRTSDVFPLGLESPASKRQLFTVNAVVSIRICC